MCLGSYSLDQGGSRGNSEKGTAKQMANKAKGRGRGKVEEVWGTHGEGQGRRIMSRAVSMGSHEGRGEGRQKGMEEGRNKGRVRGQGGGQGREEGRELVS